MRRFVTVGPAFVVLMTALVTLVAAPAAVRSISYAQTDAQVRIARASLDADDLLERMNAAVQSIAELAEPSVVHISTSGRRLTGWRRSSQGSGWVFDQKGHIITNAHVVRDGRSVRVQFHDGRVLSAEIVGLDETTDIAVLRVSERDGLFPARRDGDGRVRQGDRVFAFGSPFGFKFSMSEGIVSGLGRDPRDVIKTAGGGYTNFIQTDAAVNPGNSGGPLIDVNGRVVGMNVAIATGSDNDGSVGEGQSAGISFAIPLGTIESVAMQLIRDGVVSKGFLGIVHSGSDVENFERIRGVRPGLRGVYIDRVASGGPADRAGIRAGDIITAIGGVQIESLPTLRSQITNHRAGETIDIEFVRGDSERAVRVTLDDLSKTDAGRQRALEALASFGVVIVDASDEGVLVDRIESGSLADRAGLSKGDMIVRLDKKLVSSVDAMLQLVNDTGFVNGRRVQAVVVAPNSGRERVLDFRLLN